MSEFQTCQPQKFKTGRFCFLAPEKLGDFIKNRETLLKDAKLKLKSYALTV